MICPSLFLFKFISELDDIAFALAKLDVLGRRLQRACTARLYQTEFEKKRFGRGKKTSMFLKGVYFLNLALFLFFMSFISVRQNNGYYQCDEITVDFGDAVWEEPVVVFEDGTVMSDLRDFTLVFSYFNGTYEQALAHFRFVPHKSSPHMYVLMLCNIILTASYQQACMLRTGRVLAVQCMSKNESLTRRTLILFLSSQP